MDEDSRGRGDEYSLELAFLKHRLNIVELAIADQHADLERSYPAALEVVHQVWRCPYGEEGPIGGLPRGADAALLRFKRERRLLEWLRESVDEVPLADLLWRGPSLLMEEASSLEQEALQSGTHAEEYWELQNIADTLRVLWGMWCESERSGGP